MVGSTSPIVDIMAMILEKNNVPAYQAGMFIPFKLVLAANVTDGNTEISVFGDVEMGIQGKTVLKYDRLDLKRIYNDFVDTSKKPALRVSHPAGTKLKFFSMLDAIKAMLGVEFLTVAPWIDVTDFDIVVPAKNAKQDFVITINANSLQYLPGKNITLTLVNTGVTIQAAATTRAIEPYVKADKNIVWTGPAYNIETEKRVYSPIVLRSRDFTKLMTKPAVDLVRRVDTSDPARFYTKWYYQDSFVDDINAALERITGKPGTMPKGQVLRSWSERWTDPWTHQQTWDSVIRPANQLLDSHINKATFTHGLPITITASTAFIDTALVLPYILFT